MYNGSVNIDSNHKDSRSLFDRVEFHFRREKVWRVPKIDELRGKKTVKVGVTSE
jgi:hypothetical protein